MNPSDTPKKRFDSLAFYIFIATIFLAPLAFWPSQYIAINLVKTFIIVTGTMVSAVFLGLIGFKARKLVLPPKDLLWTGVLLAASFIVSAFTGVQTIRSLVGQGFEIGTAGFILATFVSGLVAFMITVRNKDRVALLYASISASFLILVVFHLLRLVFGPGFMSFGIFSSATSTLLGDWPGLAQYAAVIALVSVSATQFLPLSRWIKTLYLTLGLIAGICMYAVNDFGAWAALALVFLGLALFETLRSIKSGTGGSAISSLKHLAWIPLVACVIAAVFAWNGTVLSKPFAAKFGTSYSELSLPWQQTLDVTAGAVKYSPLFGVGPNQWNRAYLAYKPYGINETDAWSVEFNSGFGLLSTFIVTQGIVGSVLWILLLVFYGIAGVRVLRRLPEDSFNRFILVSSYSSSVFLWIILIVSTPSHAILFLTLVLSGIFVGTAAEIGLLPSSILATADGSKFRRFVPAFMILLVVVFAGWAIVYAKKTAALIYFGSGVKELTVLGDPDLADSHFAKALALDKSDVYLQARAETGLVKANQLASSVTQTTPATTSQAILEKIHSELNESVKYSEAAISFDPTNYYNYVSEARVSQTAMKFNMGNAYDAAVKSYQKAISLNPQNPLLYLSLAQLQASQNKFDDALETMGSALKAKNNYLEGIYFLSQIYAAKGDLNNAVIASKLAVELNPKSPVLQFQLGVLDYNVKDYESAAQALSKAVEIQSDYANARYFLGLSYARLGKTSDAIAQFQSLSESNPDNDEVTLILSNLKSGRSIFTDAKTATAANTSKASTLPIREKRSSR